MDLREFLLNKVQDAKIEAVSVPEWPGEDGQPLTVYVRAIGGVERDAFEEASLRKKGKNREASLANIRARLAVLAVCKGPNDPAPVFRPGDEANLGLRSAAALDRIYEVASRLAGIRDEDVEELEKNSGLLQSGDSGSS